ncbi:Hypothetical protein FKW44_019729 [Caligus rogercresseyi]|uniref:Uncharacterized protein n=1 Tax=Caligus rogercresseyi TaxID=217165 RepID=A0A7T8GWA7_CALRO|nr:Hypothetical protein FKW44_019729 [Caligus rogercresseyi]
MTRLQMTSLLMSETARLLECGPNPNPLQKVLIGGVVSAGECGLIALAERKNGGYETDGDIRFSKNPPTPIIPFGKDITREILSIPNRSRSITLLAATKILWWNTNHTRVISAQAPPTSWEKSSVWRR